MLISTSEPLTLVPTLSMCGDSITCYAWGVGGTGASLAHLYQRKLDVVNRGLGGYNTAWTIPIVERWLPRVGSNQPPTSILTLWFGANDACLPHSPQFVPLETFKSNLHKICNFLSDPKSIYYSPTTKIILITPPPVDAIVRAKELASRSPAQVPDREYERTHLYAIAVGEVARERGLPVVDCWSLLANAAERDGGLGKYLSDGLHLSPDGYAIVTNELTRIITEQLPEVMWSNLPNVFPEWASIPEGSLGDEFKIENYKRL